MRRDTRARISYVDIVMATATLVALLAILPFMTDVVDMIHAAGDPLTDTLATLTLPLILIGLLLSLGISARSR